MEVLQLGNIETETGVLGNIAAGTEVALVATQQHTAHAGVRLHRLEHCFQLRPHAAGHGVEFAGVGEGQSPYTGCSVGIPLDCNPACHGAP